MEQRNTIENPTRSKQHLICCFIVLAFLSGILLIFLNPPFTCPDENAHYINICRIADGSFFPNRKNDAVGCYITESQLDFLNKYYGKYADLSSERANFEELYLESHLNIQEGEKVFYPTGLATINPVGYLVPALGTSIVKNVFQVTQPYNLLLWMKVFNLLFYIGVVAWALHQTPILKNTMFLVALMPMSVFQAASTSYDAVLIASCFLLFACMAKLLHESETYVIGKADIFAVCFAAFWICSIKIAYAPLLLILFAIPRKKFGTVKKYMICIGSIVAVALVAYFIPTVICSVIGRNASNNNFAQVIEQKAYFKSHLYLVFPVLWNTFRTSIGFWANGYFGILGNLDTNFPKPFVALFYVILLFTAFREVSSVRKLDVRTRLLSIAGIFIFYAGTVLAMYLTWTPLVSEIGGTVSTGTQGRYFIPITLFLILIFSNPLWLRFKYRHTVDSYGSFAVKLTSVSYLALTLTILLLRYWV